MGSENNGNKNTGINLSNLFNFKKIGNILGFGSQNRNGNPLASITRLFSENRNVNNGAMYRCNVKVLPIEEAYRQIKRGEVFLIDVRTEMEYATVRLKGSVNIPLDRLQQDILNILPNKEQNIIVYCATGTRVRRAIQILWSQGYRNICIWEGAGLNTFAFQDLIIYNNGNRDSRE